MSFCIQGPVFFTAGANQTNLDNLILSIRHHYPVSRVYLATWKSKALNKLPKIDGVTLLDDPGSGERVYGSQVRNNINRQIVSSSAALSLATTEFAVKIRSDLVFVSNKLTNHLLNLPETLPSPATIFQKYVLFLDRLTFNPQKLDIPLHASDHIQAGLLQDLRRYWDLELMSSEDEEFFKESIKSGVMIPDSHVPKHRAEAYFFKELVRKNLGQDLESLLVSDRDLNLKTLEIFQSNIIPLSHKHLGIQSQKYRWGQEMGIFTYAYTLIDWKRDSERRGLSVSGYRVTIRDLLGEIIKQAGNLRRRLTKFGFWP